MSKSEGVGALYTLAEQRLFGDGLWPAEGETLYALRRKIDGGLFGQDKAPTLYGAGYPASDA